MTKNMDLELITKAISYGYELGCAATEGGYQHDADVVAESSLEDFLAKPEILE